MSPALVDPRARAAATATAASSGTLHKKTTPPTRSPRVVGRAPSDVAAPAITPSTDRLRTTVAAMDPVGAARGGAAAGNPGERNLESVFSMLFPPPKAERAPPAPPPGLSKPRFVKVRRNFASQRVRPGPAPFADSEDTTDVGYNPFRGAPPPVGDPSGTGGAAAERASGSGGFGRAEAGGADFAPGRGLNSDQGGNTVASAKDSAFAFTFGGNGISGGFEPAKSENASFVFAAGRSAVGSSDPSHLQGAKNPYFDERSPAAQSGNIKEEATPSSSGVFLFGNGSKESVVSGRSAADSYDKSAAGKLPEEMHKLHIRGSRNAGNSREAKGGDRSFGTGDGSAFVFGTNRNASSSSGESNFTAGTFVFPNSSKKCHVPDLSSTDRSDKSSVGKLPEEIQKLNINDSSMKNCSTDAENASCKFTTSGNCSSGAATIPNAGIFAFSSMAEHSSFDANMTSRLPDEMRKLNIEVPSGVDGCAKAKGPNAVDRKDTFNFGSNQNIGFSHENELPKELETVNSGGGRTRQPESWKEEGTGVFVFGSKSKKSTVSDENAFDGFDDSATGRLSEEIQKLNVGGSGNAGNVRGENDNLDSSSGGFVFGSSKIVPGSFGESNSKAGIFVFGSSSKKNNAPDLNASDGPGRSSTTNESGALASESSENVSGSFGESKPSAGCFIFGSSSAKGTDSCKGGFDGFDQRAFNKLPEEMQKMNIRGSENSNPMEKTKGGDHVTDESAFVFGSNKESPAPSGETYSTSGFFVFGSSSNRSTVFNEGLADWVDRGHKVQDKMKELNIRGPMDNDHHEKTISDDWKPMTHDNGFFVSACDKTMPASSDPLFSHVTNQDSSSDVGGAPPAPTGYHARPVADTNASSHSSSFGSVSRSSGCDSTFTVPCEGLGMPQMKFGMPKEDSSCYSKDSGAQRQNAASNVKKGAFSHARAKKRRGKLRDSAVQSQRGGKGFTSRGTSSQINSELDSAGDYSPMDFSPCHLETSAVDECSREASVASGESIDFGSHHSSTGIQNSVSVDEDLVHATECSDINEEYLNHELHEDDVKQAGDCGTGFTFASCSNGINELGFTFAATTSTQGSFSASRHRRKFRAKVGRDSYISNLDANVQFPSPAAHLFPDVSIPSHLDSAKAQIGVPSVTQCLKEKNLERNKVTEVRQDSASMATASIAAQEACEKWRLRGNQAYANGDLSKAEEYYTKGVNSILPNETLRSCTHALMLCYSNRAATRMSIGRIREALSDCMMASGIDPGFLKAQLRAANCHLLLGEVEDASTYFKKCLAKGNEVCLDHKFIAEASDGLQKTKRVADYMKHAMTLLRERTNSEATSVIQIISDALSLCPYSESLKEMKADALMLLRRYDELIQHCDQTLESAELNSSLSTPIGQIKKGDNSSRLLASHARAWRCYFKSKAYFCLGRLDEALSLLQEQERVEGIDDGCGSSSSSLTLLSATVRELLHLKIAGNTAFKAGRHSEAVEHYTAALTYNIESRPFAAVCFCNRAAAYQALGQITDAISDCSLAIALDPNYLKAISRRATLHEMIRDYSQASSDLHRLVSLLERKLGDQSGGRRTTSNGDDLELVHLRLAKVEDKARKEIPLDMYKILGIETSSDAAEIKKAYRKAALRHHPDKAGQLLVRSENTDEGLWKEVADEVHRDADHLFKIIGEAYAVLSDPSKRLQYDTEEEIRTCQKDNSGGSTPRNQPGFHSSHFERSNRWQSRDPWKSHGSSNQRWSGSYRTNRHF